jgi:hypothetical protein
VEESRPGDARQSVRVETVEVDAGVRVGRSGSSPLATPAAAASDSRTYVRRFSSGSGTPIPSGSHSGRTSTLVNGTTER